MLLPFYFISWKLLYLNFLILDRIKKLTKDIIYENAKKLYGLSAYKLNGFKGLDDKDQLKNFELYD